MSEKKPMPELPADRNVDQIRDILFGGQMRDYERRFQELGGTYTRGASAAKRTHRS